MPASRTGSPSLNLITGLYQRWRHLAHELAKFGIVGAVNTVLDFGLANLLYLGLGWPAMGAKTTSVAVAATSSFFMNRHWTFRHRARTGLRREYTLFFLLNGVGLLIANACILFVEQGPGQDRAAVVQHRPAGRPGPRHGVPVHHLQAVGLRVAGAGRRPLDGRGLGGRGRRRPGSAGHVADPRLS